MKSNYLLIAGLALVVFVFLSKISGVEKDVTPSLDIQKPTDAIAQQVSKITNIVTNDTDRLNLAVFNKVFADRIISYDIDTQKLNHLYTLAGKYFFGDSLKDKYADLDIFLINSIIDTVGDKNHILSDNEKLLLQEKFYGIAWYLNN
jgi:hypothetical protein